MLRQSNSPRTLGMHCKAMCTRLALRAITRPAVPSSPIGHQPNLWLHVRPHTAGAGQHAQRRGAVAPQVVSSFVGTQRHFRDPTHCGQALAGLWDGNFSTYAVMTQAVSCCFCDARQDLGTASCGGCHAPNGAVVCFAQAYALYQSQNAASASVEDMLAALENARLADPQSQMAPSNRPQQQHGRQQAGPSVATAVQLAKETLMSVGYSMPMRSSDRDRCLLPAFPAVVTTSSLAVKVPDAMQPVLRPLQGRQTHAEHASCPAGRGAVRIVSARAHARRVPA